jgi:hypothetical protein
MKTCSNLGGGSTSRKPARGRAFQRVQADGLARRNDCGKIRTPAARRTSPSARSKGKRVPRRSEAAARAMSRGELRVAGRCVVEGAWAAARARSSRRTPGAPTAHEGPSLGRRQRRPSRRPSARRRARRRTKGDWRRNWPPACVKRQPCSWAAGRAGRCQLAMGPSSGG